MSQNTAMLTTEKGNGIAVAPYLSRDKARVFRLLSFLPVLYPNGLAWLETRLDDVLSGKARCTLAHARSQLAGITIETPKGRYAVKLSTIWVAPEYRGAGVGATLLAASCSGWGRMGIRAAHVTADTRAAQALWPLLWKFGFRFSSVEKARYGEGRDEAVFHWGNV